MDFTRKAFVPVTAILLQTVVSICADRPITVISDAEPGQFPGYLVHEHMNKFNQSMNAHTFPHDNGTHHVNGYSPVVSALLAIVLVPIAITTIGGNFLVILAVTLVRKLQSPSNILIVSLAFSDFLVGLLVLPFAIIDLLKGSWPFNEMLCDMYISFDVLLCTASILNLCAISIDRYMVITRPLTYVSKRTPCRMAQMIVATWIISALICIPPNIGWKYPFQEGKCLYSEDVGYQIYATTCAFYLPLIVMLVLYGRIFKLAREISRAEQRQLMPSTQNNVQEVQFRFTDSPTAVEVGGVQTSTEKSENEMFTRNPDSRNNTAKVVARGSIRAKSGHPVTNGQSKRSKIRRETTNTVTFSYDESHPQTPLDQHHSSPDLFHRKSSGSSERKVIKTLGIIMGCFCLCWLPFFMVQLLLALLKAGKIKTDGLVPKAAFQFLQWLGYINSSLNPLIYAKFNQEFRSPFKMILLCQCRNINARLRSAAFSAQYGLSSSASHRTSLHHSTSSRLNRRSRLDSTTSGRRRPPSQLHTVESGELINAQ
uniref:5-hydroxytryptamine receptor 1A-1 n=1 Tax=Cryptocotyle lingua TaxID=66766 RepID=A0A7U0YEI9_9TREM|nr:5-hydroxytryptamine receptor 1A-1 [Cryptocotyle lingua]